MKRTKWQYDVLEILGEGSFGTVCVARMRNDPLRRRVALKILKVAYTKNKKITDRTRDEGKLMSMLTHPNIVRVYDLCEMNRRPVVVMEHVEGVSLEQLLLRLKGGLPAITALEVMRQTCLALHAAYAEPSTQTNRPLRVIHRDIKPSNVMLSIHGEVKVLDFGIARWEDEERTAHTESVVMGSRPYMAPERLDGQSDSPAVDVYSAGMTLYELLTGKPMNLSINPTSHDQAMSKHLQYVQVQGMSASAQEDLRDLIRRMCAYNRDFRPSAHECARDLEQLTYAIDRRYHIQIEEFARTTVVPIYETRPRTLPESDGSGEGDELLREVTGAITSPTPPGRMTWVPYAFVGGLAVLVAVLAVLAGLKAYRTGALAWSGAEAHVAPIDDGKVRVVLWIPAGSHAQVDDVFLAAKGAARVDPGPTQLELSVDGRTVGCAFDARDGIEVRWVGDDSISVDDGESIRCAEIRR
ncbi:MAG: serine/threonine-protein kinase [Myxococcota bacterium]